MSSRSQLISFTLHAAAAAVCLLLPSWILAPVEDNAPRVSHRVVPQPLLWHRQAAPQAAGGGSFDARPATRGAVPQVIRPVFIPPAIARNETPKLILDSGLDVAVPRMDLPVMGNPLASAAAGGPPSGGRGGARGLGDDGSDGVGNGPGGRGGFQKVLGATPPVVIYKVEPDYADEARKAHLQGTVLVAVDIDEQGRVSRVRVLQPLGLGLDEKAVDAVQRWRFRPALKDGKPVPYPAAIEVRFQLL